MTPQGFINARTNVRSDFDGAYGAQCLDLIGFYLQEVYGISGWAIARPTAYQVWSEFGNLPASQYFDRIPNTPTGIPQLGDIVIWNTSVGPAGHIAIATGRGDVNRFTSFDQNWPGGSLPHLQDHSYYGVVGWLRRKQPTPASQPKGDIMDTSTGGELYLTALHRPAENAGAAGQWNGRPARDALIQLRNEPEWQTVDTKVRLFDSIQAKVNELSARPTVEQLKAITDQLKAAQAEVEAVKNAPVSQDQAAAVVADVVKPAVGFWAKVMAILKGVKQ